MCIRDSSTRSPDVLPERVNSRCCEMLVTTAVILMILISPLVVCAPLVMVGLFPSLRKAVFIRPALFRTYLCISFWPSCWLRRALLRLRSRPDPQVIYCSSPEGSITRIPRSQLPETWSGCRCVCVSDTHGFQNDLPTVPPADVLLHCGDFLLENRQVDPCALARMRELNDWMQRQPVSECVVIAGNHDGACVELGTEGTQQRLPHATYLQDSAYTLGCGLRVFGTPGSVRESNRSHNRAFQPAKLGEDLGESLLGEVPGNIHVMMSHGPPAGVLDGGCGSRRLREVVQAVKPAVHCFGHVHSRHGVEVHDGTVYVNCASVDSMYAATHRLIVVDIPLI
eukprot:TRINITY_DN7850_c0_g1_i9.p1 TRINITY_DN7850_c0_g1~~TRINITY_DN7850_c0_g1_i9.p1  ORF type:complete len:339 (+),score=48.24 TRINITY_DN7850_c0_g1_i9:72-1088(+)